MSPYHLLRIKQVEARTGLHRSQIYAWMKEGHFPQSCSGTVNLAT
jgi:predicted DNA-binding transcriptional regulator AlpA